jgi:hypothetical protein
MAEIIAHSLMPDAATLKECLPSKTDGYEFEEVIGFHPPVGHDEMKAYLYKRGLEKEKEENYHLCRFPGYKENPMDFGDHEHEKYVWGIQMVEDGAVKYLFVPVLLSIIASMIFGITYSAVMNNTEGGFTVAAYMLSALLAGFGVIQFLLENS